MEDDLVGDGRVVRLETVGHRTGEPRPVTVGFVREPDGSLLVAAQEPTTAWALNLIADPACRVTLADDAWDAVAEPLDRAGHAVAIRALILRYGTPSEDLGRGPSFRLRRLVRS
jgi:deazaflavin-dependent oxidoreductase (nitroreductase family)